MFRFLLPSSLGPPARQLAPRLEAWLARVLRQAATVAVAQDYQALTADVLAGRADAAWAPPYVCARLEAMGARVLARVQRRGGVSYRAALLCRAEEPLKLDALSGRRAAWVDRDSVAGYLLALAHLKGQGMDPTKTFVDERFMGSYAAAVEAVVKGDADVTSVYAPLGPPDGPTGLDEIAPARRNRLSVVAFTEPAPNDGVALSIALGSDTAEALGRALTEMHTSEEGGNLLRDLFHAERYELAPRLGYRALYRVALAGI